MIESYLSFLSEYISKLWGSSDILIFNIQVLKPYHSLRAFRRETY